MKTLLIVITVLIVGIIGFFSLTPTGHRIINTYTLNIQKADDDTKYETKKVVENTCRSMIASYNSDKLIYEQYIDSIQKEEVSWANQAMMRANKTASSYNHFVLKNEFIWSGNVPSDIFMELNILKKGN